MNTTHTYGSDLVSLTGNCISLHALYLIMNRRLTDPCDTAGLLIAAAGLAAVYLLLVVCLHIIGDPRPVPAVIAAAAILQILALRRFGQSPDSLLGWLCLLFLWGIPWFRANDFFYHPETPEQRLLDFELTAIVSLVLAVIAAGGMLPGTVLIPPILSMALQLVSLAYRRSAGTSGQGRWSAALLGPVVLLAVTGSLVALLSPLQQLLHRGVSGAAYGIRDMFLRLGAVVSAFLRWLFSHFAFHSSQMALPEPETQAAAEMTGGGLPSVDAVMTPILLLFLLIGAAAFFLLARRRPLPRPRAVRRAGRTFSPGQVIRDFLYRLRQWFHFRVLYLKYRDTAQGLFCRIEFSMAARHAGRQDWESPRAFLQRAAGCYPGCEEDLRRLAELLEQHWFSGEKPSAGPEEIARIRTHLKNAAPQKQV